MNPRRKLGRKKWKSLAVSRDLKKEHELMAGLELDYEIYQRVKLLTEAEKAELVGLLLEMVTTSDFC
nr:MAG TPA: hypothetical protein [Caudoviricetes sp.]